MRLATLDSMLSQCVAIDTETDPVQPGLGAPPLVLGSAGWWDPTQQKIVGELLDKRSIAHVFHVLLQDPTRVIAGANLSYDLLVLAIYCATKLGVDAMPPIYRALMDEQRVFDIQIAEMLDAIAEGCLGKDPRSGGMLMSPETGRRAGYSLSVVTDLVLGRTDAKVLGHAATEYGKYHDVPLAELPEHMQIYPVDDGRNTAEDALAQSGHLQRAGVHRWGSNTVCDWCGVHPRDANVDGRYEPCRVRRRSRNLHDLANQVGTAWAMHLAGNWGFRVDQTNVDKIEADALDGREEAEVPFVDCGLLKRNRDGSTKRDMSAIFRRVAIAYGAREDVPCQTCKGTRKVVSTKAKQVKCPMCRGAGVFSNGGLPNACPTCSGQKTIPDPKQLINCTECGATGLDLDQAPHLPKTETGRVGSGRDVLNEAGDEILMAFADHQEDAKTLSVYVPWLRRARAPIAGHGAACPTKNEDDPGECNCEGPYRDIPLTLWPNVLLETGRTSYRGVVQLLPRKPGFWVEKFKLVEVPDDYALQSGEEFVE